MKFGVIISRKVTDRSSSHPYAKLYSYLNEMEDLGYDMGWCGQHRFSLSTAFFLTPTGVPNTDGQVRELRLFAKEVMPLLNA